MLLILSLHLEPFVEDVHLLLEAANFHDHRVNQLTLLVVFGDVSCHLRESSNFLIFIEQFLLHPAISRFKHVNFFLLLLNALDEHYLT